MTFDPQEAERLAGQLDTYDPDFDPSDVLDEAAAMLRVAVSEIADLRAADHSDCNEALEARRVEVMRLMEQVRELKDLVAQEANRRVAAEKVVEAVKKGSLTIDESGYEDEFWLAFFNRDDYEAFAQALREYDQGVTT